MVHPVHGTLKLKALVLDDLVHVSMYHFYVHIAPTRVDRRTHARAGRGRVPCSGPVLVSIAILVVSDALLYFLLRLRH